MGASRLITTGGRRIRRTRLLLAERDGTGCGRCGQPIDLSLSGAVPLGPTIGHRSPASRGGSDYLDNLQLEHRRCNLAAGARIDPPRAAMFQVEVARWS